MANASQAQKNIVRSFVGEGPVADLIAAGPAPAPVPAGLIRQSFFVQVAPTTFTGATVDTPIAGAQQVITTVAGSKLRVTVMHAISLNAAGGQPAQLNVQIKIDGGSVLASVPSPVVPSGFNDVVPGSIMYQASFPPGPHTVTINQNRLNALNVGTVSAFFPLQMLVEEISG